MRTASRESSDGAASSAGFPTGRTMRRWTRYAIRRRAERSAGELLSDIYSVIFTLAVNISMVAALARSQGIDRMASTTTGGVDLGWATILLALAASGLGLGVLARLGPVSLGAAQASWWLPLPGDRRSLLLPAARLPTMVAAAVGAVLLGLLALAVDPAVTVVSALAAVGCGAGSGAALALVLVPVEASGRRRVAASLGDAVLAAVSITAVGLALTAPATPPQRLPWLLLGVIAVLLAAAASLVARRSLDQIHDSELRDRGALAGELRGAALALDTRALGRAVGGDVRARGSRRSSSLRVLEWLATTWPGRRRTVRAGLALLTADLMTLRRSGRSLVQVASGTALAVAALLLTELSALVTGTLVVLGGWIAALATAGGARHGEFVPSVDALLPLSLRAVRGWRLVLPVLVMLGWAVVVAGMAAWRLGGLPTWLLLGVLAGPVWAAGAVRSAYRPPADWSAPLIVTPMGAYPPGLATVASKGPDVVLLGAIPLLVAVLTGAVSPAIVWLQVALTTVVVAIALHPGTAPDSGPGAPVTG